MIINSFPSNNTNAVASYTPPGKPLVGQENSDLKSSSLKALEQSASSARNENKRVPDDKTRSQDQQQTKTDNRTDEAQADKLNNQRETESAKKEQLIKDQAKISALSARDREVRAHEQAHAAVGGQYAGSPTYEFVRGPNGVNYAVGGEVSISSGSVPNDPEATIQKAQQIRAAANAPADPSGQDRSVAAAATNLENDARNELNTQKNAELLAKEKLAEEKINAQKAEETKKQAQEEQYNNEQKKELARQEKESTQKNTERANTFEKINNKTFNITRHLIDIGATKGSSAVGNLLNSRV